VVSMKIVLWPMPQLKIVAKMNLIITLLFDRRLVI
jgi:hypothetical protein